MNKNYHYFQVTTQIQDAIAIISFEWSKNNTVDDNRTNFKQMKVLVEGSEEIKGIVVLLHDGSGFMDSAPRLSFNGDDDDFDLQLLNFFNDLAIPSLAVVTGRCTGFFLKIAMAASIRICDPDTLFYFPEKSSFFLNHITIADRLNKLLKSNFQKENPDLFTMNICSDMAKESGFVNCILPKEGLKENSMNLLSRMVENRRRYVIDSTMKTLTSYLKYPPRFALEEEWRQFCLLIHKSFINL
ncbi:MAG: hypothetical protein KKE44_23175 [Proteobacteria bacterium]|nr:hypothetical protein [Pseudomonadota bacterium]MBU1585638.1 hypothetical protein [Pseudomonadota bacterium]MBU2629636.1 hypothetical protein [Pseudomonadota bacterium]